MLLLLDDMKQAATSGYADDEKDYDGTKPLYHWAYICQSGSRHVLILRARSISFSRF